MLLFGSELTEWRPARLIGVQSSLRRDKHKSCILINNKYEEVRSIACKFGSALVFNSLNICWSGGITFPSPSQCVLFNCFRIVALKHIISNFCIREKKSIPLQTCRDEWWNLQYRVLKLDTDFNLACHTHLETGTKQYTDKQTELFHTGYSAVMFIWSITV